MVPPQLKPRADAEEDRAARLSNAPAPTMDRGVQRLYRAPNFRAAARVTTAVSGIPYPFATDVTFGTLVALLGMGAQGCKGKTLIFAVTPHVRF